MENRMDWGVEDRHGAVSDHARLMDGVDEFVFVPLTAGHIRQRNDDMRRR